MIIVNSYLVALLLVAGNAVTRAQVIDKDLIQNDNNERDRRAIDFGFFVRNLLLKSATASNAKANISRNVLNFRTATPAPTKRTTTTTTTTVAPFFFNKGPFRFPFDLSAPINNKFKGGYLNFDYDYDNQQPVRPGRRRRPTTSTTTTTTTTTAPPAATPPPPPRRRPIPRRPYGLFGKQKLPLFDYYYDDYDYNYDDANNNPPASPAPPPPPPPASTPAPVQAPNPPPARPVKQPAINRNRAQGRVSQLRNRLVYQFRQPGDISTNNNAPQQPAADEGSQQPPSTNGNNSNNDETSTNANDDVYDDTDDATADNGGTDTNNNIPDDKNSNTEQDYNDSSDNVNPNTNNGNAPPPPPPSATNSNFDFNANVLPFQGQFNFVGNPNPSGLGNFGAAGGFPYSPFNNFNPQYQPASPAGYSVRYY